MKNAKGFNLTDLEVIVLDTDGISHSATDDIIAMISLCTERPVQSVFDVDGAVRGWL